MVELWDILDKDRRLTGKTFERGWLKPGVFHLIVNVWIKNNEGKYLISKRTANKRWPNLWGPTIGSAIAGDDSLTTALKEASEELGIKLDPNKGTIFKEYIHYVEESKDRGEFIDVWLFNQEVDLSKVVFQPDETCDAKWADRAEIDEMMRNGTFIPLEDMPYFDELK